MQLREGISTGTTAAAAAMAALQLLATNTLPPFVNVPMPPFSPDGSFAGTRAVPIHSGGQGLPVHMSDYRSEAGKPAAWAGAVKDGGDDPDVTSGLLICASIWPVDLADCPRNPVLITGGPGVGTVTLDGLPMPPGSAAINPVPRQQISLAAQLAGANLGGMLMAPARLLSPPWQIVISVPDGAKAAAKTMNPRLGITGGISILGTQGTVRPFSHDAWRASVMVEMQAARAQGAEMICLATGRRSQRLLEQLYPQLPQAAFIQAADIAAFALGHAGRLGFKKIVWGCFFGKLLKLAQGLENTHAATEAIDFGLLQRLCFRQDPLLASKLENALTAQAALEMILRAESWQTILHMVLTLAQKHARAFAGHPTKIHLFHPDGRELARI